MSPVPKVSTGNSALRLSFTGAASDAASVSGLLPSTLRTSLISPLLSACASLLFKSFSLVLFFSSSCAVDVSTLRMLDSALPAVFDVESRSLSVESKVSDPLASVDVTLEIELLIDVICGLISLV